MEQRLGLASQPLGIFRLLDRCRDDRQAEQLGAGLAPEGRAVFYRAAKGSGATGDRITRVISGIWTVR
jgi:hypothetical protein